MSQVIRTCYVQKLITIGYLKLFEWPKLNESIPRFSSRKNMAGVDFDSSRGWGHVNSTTWSYAMTEYNYYLAKLKGNVTPNMKSNTADKNNEAVSESTRGNISKRTVYLSWWPYVVAFTGFAEKIVYLLKPPIVLSDKVIEPIIWFHIRGHITFQFFQTVIIWSSHNFMWWNWYVPPLSEPSKATPAKFLREENCGRLVHLKPLKQFQQRGPPVHHGHRFPSGNFWRVQQKRSDQ